jgi:hypothetical protein
MKLNYLKALAANTVEKNNKKHRRKFILIINEFEKDACKIFLPISRTKW